jgi:hypothetical protein
MHGLNVQPLMQFGQLNINDCTAIMKHGFRIAEQAIEMCLLELDSALQPGQL